MYTLHGVMMHIHVDQMNLIGARGRHTRGAGMGVREEVPFVYYGCYAPYIARNYDIIYVLSRNSACRWLTWASEGTKHWTGK